MPSLKYLGGYPPDLLDRVQRLIDDGGLAQTLGRRYPDAHSVRTDRALYDYVSALKSEFMRNADPLDKVVFDGRLHVIRNALGTHTTVWRVQGTKIKAKREIRVANLFKDAPAPFLKMIVVHELAHLKQREHDKAFYALCEHMEPAYHQLEFDFRLYLTLKEQQPPAREGAAP
ncbi:MAG: M48 family metallopeptidase [Burkholderiaceae bacterium]|nr:M48 family metallopeptidase [Burkholderiaceae bacterium]